MSNSFAADAARNISKNLTMRVEQKIRVCIKPRPKFIPQKLWLKLVALFIYVEKTEPSFSVDGEL